MGHSFRDARDAVYDSVNRHQYYRDHFRGLTAFERHKQLTEDYFKHYGCTAGGVRNPQDGSSGFRTDIDTIRESFRFIRTAADDSQDTFVSHLARKYYEKLYKEYCIADLTRYKEHKLGLRWRTEKEVVAGKGQFICGANSCDQKDGLGSYEVNFVYVEEGVKKQALVKVRLCPDCAYKLNYKREKRFRQVASLFTTALEGQEKSSKSRKRKRSRDGEGREVQGKSTDTLGGGQAMQGAQEGGRGQGGEGFDQEAEELLAELFM